MRKRVMQGAPEPEAAVKAMVAGLAHLGTACIAANSAADEYKNVQLVDRNMHDAYWETLDFARTVSDLYLRAWQAASEAAKGSLGYNEYRFAASGAWELVERARAVEVELGDLIILLGEVLEALDGRPVLETLDGLGMRLREARLAAQEAVGILNTFENEMDGGAE